MIVILLTEAPFLTYTFPVVRVDYSNEASVTEHPVEIGAMVSDHVQTRPARFSVEALVTSSPLLIPVPFAIDLARTFLETALGKVATVTIPGEGVFTSYVLEGFTHSFSNIEARTFAMRFRQVRIALSLSVVIPPRMPAPVAAVGAPDAAALGQQAATAVPPTSVLKGVVDLAASLFAP